MTTELFTAEGKANTASVIESVTACISDFGIRKVIVFAASRDSVQKLRAALPEWCNVTAVTFPHEYRATVEEQVEAVGIRSNADREALSAAGVEVVRAGLPFGLGELRSSPYNRGYLDALGLFGGGTHLCVEAAIIAADAGAVDEGEKCAVMSADTAIVMRAGHSFYLGTDHSGLAVEHFICKPTKYQISRPEAISVQTNIVATEPLAIGEAEDSSTQLSDANYDGGADLNSIHDDALELGNGERLNPHYDEK